MFSEVLRAVIPNSSIKREIFLYDCAFLTPQFFTVKCILFFVISFKLKSERVANCGPPPPFHKPIGWLHLAAAQEGPGSIFTAMFLSHYRHCLLPQGGFLK